MATAQTQNQVQSALLLYVVIRESAPILELLSGKDQPLLIRWDTFLVLDFCLHVVDGVRGLHIQCDGLASQGLDEDLHREVNCC